MRDQVWDNETKDIVGFTYLLTAYQLQLVQQQKKLHLIGDAMHLPSSIHFLVFPLLVLWSSKAWEA